MAESQASNTSMTSQPARNHALLHVDRLPFDVETFAARGWVRVSLKPTLHQSYQSLLERMHEFFDLPLEEKMKFHIPARMQTSEEGFSVVEGEKMMITVRRGNPCPDVLKKEAQAVWTESGALLEEIMQGIALSLGLPETKFENLVKPCVETLRENDRVSTLLRMFRYIRPEEDAQPKIVSEEHRDVGLITLVVGHSPGLEAWDPGVNGGKGDWVSVEEELEPKLGSGDVSKLSATLLSGLTLVRLSNNLYQAARHRVVVHPPSEAFPSPFRFSLVHALRAHLPVVISSSEYTSAVTGEFSYPFGIDQEVRMGHLFNAISKVHFSVNIDRDLREQQRKEARQRILPPQQQNPMDGSATENEKLQRNLPQQQPQEENLMNGSSTKKGSIRGLLRKTSIILCYRTELSKEEKI